MLDINMLADKEKDQHARFKFRWLLLMVCGYWILATIEHRGWVSIWDLLANSLGLNVDLALAFLLVMLLLIFSILMIAVTLLLSIAVICHFSKFRQWHSSGLLLLLSLTILIIILMPSKVASLFYTEREWLEAVVTQAERYTVRHAYLEDLPLLRPLMKQMPDVVGKLHRNHETDPDIVCLYFFMDDSVSLLYSANDQYMECLEGKSFLWVHRLDESWFEISTNPSLWFLPDFAN